jgi:carotenoid cleavage dioxygenase
MQRRQVLKSIAGVAGVGASGLVLSNPIAALANTSVNTSRKADLLVNAKQAFKTALKTNPTLLGLKNTHGNFPPQQLTIEGKLPTDISGVLYRNGPAKFERGDQRYLHQFEGDGMVNSFTFSEGKISHQAKFVQTTKFIAEQQQSKFLYTGPLSKIKNSGSVSHADVVNTANINVIPVNDEVWALWESGSATALNAETLTTKRRVNLGDNSQYGDKLKGLAFSAHPKIEANGDIWNFGLSLSGHIALYQLSAKGSVKNVGMVNARYRGKMLHDFLITHKHILLILPSLTAKPANDPSATGLFNSIQYDKNLPMQVLVIDKQTLTLKKQFELDAGFAFHFGNAWEESDGTIHFDASINNNFDVMDELSQLMSGKLRSLDNSPHTALFTLHPNGSTTKSNIDGDSEFPRVYDHLVGQRNKKLYTLSHSQSNFWRDTVCCLDIDSGEKDNFVYGEDFIVEEHIIVSKTTKEGDGYLVGTALHIPSKRSCLNIFKANQLSSGPICRAWLPYHLPLGLHGSFKWS